MPELSTNGSVAISGLGALSWFGLFSWIIPGFFLGLSGLLIVGTVAAQLFGGVLFVPITRRVLGGFRIARRRPPAEGGPG